MKMEIKQNIDSMLKAIPFKKDKLRFLNLIYEPGDTDIADTSLSLDYDYKLAEKEIEFARDNGNMERAIEMGKELFDHTYKVDQHPSEDEVIKLGIKELANYAIEHVTVKDKKENTEWSLKYIAAIAGTFDQKELAENCLEKLLTFTDSKTSKLLRTIFPEIPQKFKPDMDTAKILGILERFDEAIDCYLNCENYLYISNAIEIAKKHSPDRIAEVAKKGFNLFPSSYSSWKEYLEYAQMSHVAHHASKTLNKPME